MRNLNHSVTLDKEKCKGCTTCIKRCPTEAIRVRNGKAKILEERCVDCGECIRVCPQRAKKAVYDSLDSLAQYKYKIALPAPSLYGQFQKLRDVNYVLNGLLLIGFDEVYEVALAAQTVSDLTNRLLREPRASRKAYISSACPAIVRLISVRFPNLIDNVLPIMAPVELAAVRAREQAAEKTGLPPSEIGVFFISPCPAKVTASKSPIGFEKPLIDGVLSMSDVYMKLIGVMNKLSPEDLKPLAKASFSGINWASSGGEGKALLHEPYIAADGIDNCIQVLEALEDEKLRNVDFIELGACVGGCVGGCLAIENPFVARSRIKRLREGSDAGRSPAPPVEDIAEVQWQQPLEYTPVLKIADNMQEAMRRMRRIDEIEASLPGLDCGSCGAPSCRALAEDIVRGIALEDDCVFKQRERIQHLMNEMTRLQQYVPPPFRKNAEDDQTTKKEQQNDDR